MHEEPTHETPVQQEPTQETPEHQEPTWEASEHQEPAQETPVHQVTSREPEASCKPEEDSSMCESTADRGETTLLGLAGPTVEKKAPQETEVLPEESDKTREGVSERPLEKEDLDEGESLPTLGLDNLGLGLEEAEQEKELLVVGLKGVCELYSPQLGWALVTWMAKEAALSTRKHGSTRRQRGRVKASTEQRKMLHQQARHGALAVK